MERARLQPRRHRSPLIVILGEPRTIPALRESERQARRGGV
jgi:hypothetical protein